MDNRLYSLDNRLMMCANFVRKGAKFADIGTDHAYLPVWLLKNNIITYAIASDINQGPLDSGKATAEKYHCTNIEFRLGSGLETINESDEITDVVIAGMGGELIAELIKSSHIVKNQNVNLILQPMTKSEILIDELYNMGFEIKEQKSTVSSNKCYTVILAEYTGEKTQKDPYFLYVGKLDLDDDVSKRFVRQHINNLENKSKGDPSLIPLLNKLKESI